MIAAAWELQHCFLFLFTGAYMYAIALLKTKEMQVEV